MNNYAVVRKSECAYEDILVQVLMLLLIHTVLYLSTTCTHILGILFLWYKQCSFGYEVHCTCTCIIIYT